MPRSFPTLFGSSPSQKGLSLAPGKRSCGVGVKEQKVSLLIHFRAILDSALDLDKGPNGEIVDYQIK